jgi:hypothetical protein
MVARRRRPIASKRKAVFLRSPHFRSEFANLARQLFGLAGPISRRAYGNKLDGRYVSQRGEPN